MSGPPPRSTRSSGPVPIRPSPLSVHPSANAIAKAVKATAKIRPGDILIEEALLGRARQSRGKRTNFERDLWDSRINSANRLLETNCLKRRCQPGLSLRPGVWLETPPPPNYHTVGPGLAGPSPGPNPAPYGARIPSVSTANAVRPVSPPRSPRRIREGRRLCPPTC